MAEYVNLKNLDTATLGWLLLLLDPALPNGAERKARAHLGLESFRARLEELELAARKSTCPGVEMDLETGAVAGIERSNSLGWKVVLYHQVPEAGRASVPTTHQWVFDHEFEAVEFVKQIMRDRRDQWGVTAAELEEDPLEWAATWSELTDGAEWIDVSEIDMTHLLRPI